MANGYSLQDVINQIRQGGNIPPGGAGNTAGRDSQWEKVLAQMAMAQKTTPDVAAGVAAGKLLRGLFDDWKENYDARGDLNRIIETADPKKRAEMVAFIQQTNPERLGRIQKYADKRGFNLGLGGDTPGTGTNTEAGVNSDVTAKLAQRAVPGLLSGGDSPDTALSQALQGEQQQPWEDENNWQKWAQLFGGVR